MIRKVLLLCQNAKYGTALLTAYLDWLRSRSTLVTPSWDHDATMNYNLENLPIFDPNLKNSRNYTFAMAFYIGVDILKSVSSSVFIFSSSLFLFQISLSGSYDWYSTSNLRPISSPADWILNQIAKTKTATSHVQLHNWRTEILESL